MKIIHLCLACLFNDGMNYQENLLVQKHAELGHKVYVVANKYQRNKTNSIVESDYTYRREKLYEIYRVNKGKYFFSRKLGYKLNYFDGVFDIIVNIHPDIIFVHGCQFSNYNDIVLYKKINPLCKVFVDNHSDYENTPIKTFKQWIVNKMYYRHCARKLDKVTEKWWGTLPIRCNFLHDVYKIPESKIGFLPMGIDEELIKNIPSKEDIRKEYGIDTQTFVIGTGGKIDRDKKILELFRTLFEIKKSTGFKFELVVFGEIEEGYKKELMPYNELINIHYVKWVEANKLPRLLSCFDLCVFLGGHSVIWEQCVSLGIPCIFGKHKGIEHLQINNNCIFVDSNNKEELFNVFYKNVCDEESFLRFKTRSKAVDSEQFYYCNIAKKAIT